MDGHDLRYEQWYSGSIPKTDGFSFPANVKDKHREKANDIQRELEKANLDRKHKQQGINKTWIDKFKDERKPHSATIPDKSKGCSYDHSDAGTEYELDCEKRICKGITTMEGFPATLKEKMEAHKVEIKKKTRRSGNGSESQGSRYPKEVGREVPF